MTLLDFILISRVVRYISLIYLGRKALSIQVMFNYFLLIFRRKNLDKGVEKGASIAVYYHGELVLEFSGGYADYESVWPWSKDTLTQACSAGKGVASTVIAVLVERYLMQNVIFNL